MIRLLAIWVWGTADATAPPTPTSQGPYWIMEHHIHAIRCWQPRVRLPYVAPGRVFADDPLLNTFSSIEDEA